MTAETITATTPSATIHPAWVRVCHWINAIAILVMIGSGWQIYDASPLFDFAFPCAYALGNWLGRLDSPPTASAAKCCRSIRLR